MKCRHCGREIETYCGCPKTWNLWIHKGGYIFCRIHFWEISKWFRWFNPYSAEPEDDGE